MGAKTKIPWTGSTWNIMRGCRRRDAGCLNCYAEGQAIRSSGPGGAHEGLVRSTDNGPRWTGEVRFDDAALGVPIAWQEPRFVFVNSMSDTFYERFTDVQVAATFGAMILAPLHVYQVLTKREQRALEFFESVTPLGCLAAARTMGLRLTPRQAARFYALLPDTHTLRPLFRPGGAATCELPFPPDVRLDLALALHWPMPHLWIGASCNDQDTFDRRAPTVRRIIGGAIRFLSLEPLTGPITLGNALRGTTKYGSAPTSIEWLIPGGESGSIHKARDCEIVWIRSILTEAATAGPGGAPVAVFVKQLGAHPVAAPADVGIDPVQSYRRTGAGRVELCLLSSKGEDPDEWPDDLLVQDYPCGVYLPASVAA